METSLRYSGDSKALKLHAKEKLSIDSNTHLQLHGELDTRVGAPTYLSAMIRHNFADLSARLGVGMLYDKKERLRYHIRGKTQFPVTSDGLLTFNVKGRVDIDQEFKQRNPKGGAEFALSLLNFQRDQDIRLKVGFDVVDKLPYMQIRENNWTLNVDTNGKWNVRFDL